MASGVNPLFTEPVALKDWIAGDMAGVEISMFDNPRQSYGWMALKMMDDNPHLTILDIARQMARSQQWLYEVVREATALRNAELNSYLAENPCSDS